MTDLQRLKKMITLLEEVKDDVIDLQRILTSNDLSKS